MGPLFVCDKRRSCCADAAKRERPASESFAESGALLPFPRKEDVVMGRSGRLMP